MRVQIGYIYIYPMLRHSTLDYAKKNKGKRTKGAEQRGKKTNIMPYCSMPQHNQNEELAVTCARTLAYTHTARRELTYCANDTRFLSVSGGSFFVAHGAFASSKL